MADIGRFNTLPILKRVPFGLYLDGGIEGDILLPNRYIPTDQPTEPGDRLRVFVYLDSEDQLIATTESPMAQVGEFASLKVTDVNRVGAFLDWGLAKELLLPHGEQQRPVEVGEYCVVHVYLDNSERISASSKLDRFLDRTPVEYSPGQQVNLLIVSRTDLGFKAIINDRHWGLIHHSEVFRFLRKGMREAGFIKAVRPDGKIDLTLQAPGGRGRDALQSQILARLDQAAGVLPLSDKSAPEVITREFGVSKASFKKAIGGLFKAGDIVIYPDRIERVSD